MPIHLLPTNRAMNRREALGGLGLLGLGLAFGRTARADADDPPWYALVSDIHIAADPKAMNRQQVMAENLRAVVADILARPTRPRGVVIDGDLALKNGQTGDYRTMLDLLEPLRQADLPLHLALGNHDDRTHFRAALNVGPSGDPVVIDKHVSIVEGPGLRLVVLDSLDGVDLVPGLLGRRQLGWLAKALDAEPAAPTLVFVHHNLSDRTGALVDTPALLEVVRPRRQVKAVIHGHSHRWTREVDESGIHVVNLPAVAYPFSDDQPLGWVHCRADDAGMQIELRCVGGDRSKDRERLNLKWRGA
jgi:3',5'-cyclic AMP phosphodiesterase CpdA